MRQRLCLVLIMCFVYKTKDQTVRLSSCRDSAEFGIPQISAQTRFLRDVDLSPKL